MQYEYFCMCLKHSTSFCCLQQCFALLLFAFHSWERWLIVGNTLTLDKYLIQPLFKKNQNYPFKTRVIVTSSPHPAYQLPLHSHTREVSNQNHLKKTQSHTLHLCSHIQCHHKIMSKRQRFEKRSAEFSYDTKYSVVKNGRGGHVSCWQRRIYPAGASFLALGGCLLLLLVAASTSSPSSHRGCSACSLLAPLSRPNYCTWGMSKLVCVC